MNDQPSTKLDELLTQATESLRGTVLEGPSRELIDSTIDRLRSLETGSQLPTTPLETVRFSQRRNRLSRLVRYGALATVTLMFALFAGWWIFLDRTAVPAFAEVIQQVAKVKSVTFVSDSTLRNDATNEIVTRERAKWYVQGQQIRLEEIDGRTVLIADLEQQQTYWLDLKQKTARTESLVDEIAEMIANPLVQVQQIEANDAKLLGDDVLDGRAVQLYQVDDVAFLFMGGKGRTKIWVDPKTQLPVRIAIEPKKRKDRTGYTEISDFEWNKELDVSLFGVPQDYTMVDAQRWMRERREDAPERN